MANVVNHSKELKRVKKTLSEIESFNDPKGIYLKCEDC